MSVLPAPVGATVASEIPSSWLTKARNFFTHERLSNGKFLLLFWLSARLVVFTIWALIGATQGDVFYYYDRVALLGNLDPAQLMQEYPTPAVMFLYIPYLLGFDSEISYAIAFVVINLMLDAAFAYSLWLKGGHLRGQAVLFWTLFMMFIGPTVYLRFDLATAVPCGWALMFLLRRHTFIAGSLVGLGAAFKLWPALLWPALLGGSRRHNIIATTGVATTGIILAGASLAWGGWDRLLSPLSYQDNRGLQVESIWASVPMLERALGVGDYAVAISRWQAFEVWGSDVPIWTAIASIAGAFGYLLPLITGLAWCLRGRGRMFEAAGLMLLTITGLIVTNKTFSPQYVIWLAPTMAATFTVLGVRAPWQQSYSRDRNRLKRLSVLMLSFTLLTTVVYPISYAVLVRDQVDWRMYLQLPVTLVLVARNVLVVWFFVELLRWVWSFLNPDHFRTTRLTAPTPDGAVTPAAYGTITSTFANPHPFQHQRH
ncbi:MAG: DUF2029 domain-containing protein [Propionibacteriaceae bacterium]|jgi:hypothetical protein|nr:DUF2029 domain-containing protein [Propionibacteriaceae bacterium]